MRAKGVLRPGGGVCMPVASYYELRRVVRRAIGRGFVLEIHRAPKALVDSSLLVFRWLLKN